jgi:subtilisin family serine protease
MQVSGVSNRLRASLALASPIALGASMLASAAAVPPGVCQVAERPNDAFLAESGIAPANKLLFELGRAEWIVADEFIVEFGPEAQRALADSGLASEGRTGLELLDETLAHHGVTGIRKLFSSHVPKDLADRNLPDLGGFAVVTVDLTVTTLDAAMADLAADPSVLRVETIGVHPLYAPPNDGNFGVQWHLNQTSDKDIDAPEAWDIQNGDPAKIVAVLDSGVRYYHKDLGGANTSTANTAGTAGNIWINTAEQNGVAGTDDDGNGFVDDWVGYDFVSAAIATCWAGEDCTGADNDPRDFNGHGTHCSGIVAALNNNGYAVASPAGGFGNGTLTATGDGARVMCLKIGHSAQSGASEVGYVRMDYAASALQYAANNGARIASCSWGSSNSGGIAAACDYFLAAGGLIFKAAGNANTATADYMCSRTDVYSVAALDQTDKKASFSSYGSWVDISAPGVSIYSTYHDHNADATDYVAALSGTSMATPLVAGCAANLWSQFPTWTAAQVWERLRTTAENVDAANATFVGQLGAGRVNLHRALTNTTSGGGGGGGTTLAGKVLVSVLGSPTLGAAGVVADEDIAQYDGATGAWSVYFDGSDVGLAAYAIDALAVLPSGELLISINADGTVAGLTGGPSGTSVDDSDIIKFTPTSLGANTAGTWSFYFDGSDVGLTTTGEDIDAITILPSGAIGISTLTDPSVTGLSGLADEDVIAFTPTALGSVTSGTYAYYFDGSDVGLSTNNNEDVDAFFTDSAGVSTISTIGAFGVTGVTGTDEDAFKFTPTSTGTNTAGSFAAYFQATARGIPTSANINAIHWLP